MKAICVCDIDGEHKYVKTVPIQANTKEFRIPVLPSARLISTTEPPDFYEIKTEVWRYFAVHAGRDDEEVFIFEKYE